MGEPGFQPPIWERQQKIYPVFCHKKSFQKKCLWNLNFWLENFWLMKPPVIQSISIQVGGFWLGCLTLKDIGRQPSNPVYNKNIGS